MSSQPPSNAPASGSPDRPVEEDSSTETRRVQVVARWNSWVQVYDPSDESLSWVDLTEAQYAQA